MAAVSAWSKPGAWALETEDHEAASVATSALEQGYCSPDSHQSTADFPSLSAAATTKIPKKKKKQTLSLAEFTAAAAPSSPATSTDGKFQLSPKPLTLDEQLALPTGPRERSEEELQRSRGFGYFNGGGGSRGWSARGSDENPRRAPAREPRDLGPSRADEVDDWGSMKKSVGGFERRERERGFFDSQSRADESESWILKKGSGAVPPMGSDARRERRGYDLFNREGSNGSGVDSDSWGKKREDGSGVDSDGWGKKREDNGGTSGGRPRLLLQPRTLPITNGANGEVKKAEEVVKSKGANPFGEARPREDVLKEKGRDWKEIDEKLEAVKIQETTAPVGRKGFGMVNRLKEDWTERAWKRPEAKDVTSSPPREDPVEEQLPEN